MPAVDGVRHGICRCSRITRSSADKMAIIEGGGATRLALMKDTEAFLSYRVKLSGLVETESGMEDTVMMVATVPWWIR